MALTQPFSIGISYCLPVLLSVTLSVSLGMKVSFHAPPALSTKKSRTPGRVAAPEARPANRGHRCWCGDRADVTGLTIRSSHAHCDAARTGQRDAGHPTLFPA